MSLKQAAKLIAMVSPTIAYLAAFGTANAQLTVASTNPQPATTAAATNLVQIRRPRPDLLPISRIAALTGELARSHTNLLVRIEGVALDQGMGEYVIVQDDSGTIRAETRQTTPLNGGERVTAWGRLAWDGHATFLRNAGIRPLAWDAIAEEKITPAPNRPAQLTTLTQVCLIRDLPPSRAAWKYPVRVHGVLTTLWKDYKSLFVQDDTAGIYVSASNLKFEGDWVVGSEVEIEGVSGPGGYAPIIEATSAKIVGRGKLPVPRLVTLFQISSGQFDGQWVEARGVVRSVRINQRSTNLELSDINGLVEVEVPEGEVFTNLMDSLVRVRGVCGSRANPNRQLMGAYVWSPGTNFLVVEEKGVADPFTLPTQSIASLSQFSQWRAMQHWVKVEGVITFSEPGRPLFVQDNTGGVPVYLAEAADFQPGQRVAVAGYLAPGDFGYVFRNAQCRSLGREPIPVPKNAIATDLLNQNLNGVWVQMTARLVSFSRRAAEDVLTLQSDNSIFEALRPASLPSEDQIPPVGSVVRLQGVYSILGDESRRPRALRLYIPASQPIELLDRPSWWNNRHAAMVVGVMLFVVLGSALWAITLRRRVAEQTLVIRERLAKEAALEQGYREIFEGANDLIFTYNLEEKITSLNPAGRRVLGYADNEISDLRIDQILAPSCRSLARQLLETRPAQGTAVTCECELLTREGRTLFVETSARLILKDGKVHGVQAISRDIGERKRAEEALRVSEAHYRQLVELSPNAIFIQSQGRFAFVNQAGLELFGASTPADLLGKRILDFVHPEDQPVVTQRMAILLDNNESVPLLEERYLRLDGNLIDVEVAAAPILFENKPAAQVIVHDITERKRADEELFNSRQMLRLVLDTIPQRVFWKDRKSVYVGCNKALAQDSGYPDPNAIIGKTDFEMGWAEMAEAYRADDRQVMESGRPKLSFEELQSKPDGSKAWLKTSKVPLHDKDGRVIGVLCTYEDITVRKSAEAALAEASALLQTLLDHSPDCIYFKDRQSRFVRYSKAFERLFNVPNTEALRGRTDFNYFTEEHARVAYEDEQAIVNTGQPLIGKLEKETHQDGRVTWALTTKMPWRDKEGQIIGTFGISKDVTAIKEAEAELAYERELFRALLDNFPDSIYFKDCHSRFVRISRSKAEMTFDILRQRFLAEPGGGPSKDLPEHLTSVEAFTKYLIGKTDFETYESEFARAAFTEEQDIIATGKPVIGKLENGSHGGKWFLVTKMPWRDKDGNIIGTFGVSRDITPLKEAEAKLEAAHKRLIETSRLAGMAEVATDVLHNVGNVLNSVNVSCSLTLDRVKASKVSSLNKVSSLLEENRGRLLEFLTEDPRGRQIPEFLTALAAHLGSEQTLLLKELDELVKHIDHIKQIVAMQQTYAKVAGVVEAINPVQLVEDALQINAAALVRHDVQVQRQYADTAQILTEKHKVLQILVNLIRNAKYAMDDAKRTDKILTVKVAADQNNRVLIEVIDNGIGIPQENLTRIFSHGFTTRRNGHGFGLHSSALAVRDLGGSLQAHSDGPGSGATFSLLLPPAPPNHPQESE